MNIKLILYGLAGIFTLGIMIIGWIRVNLFLKLLMAGDTYTIATAGVIVLATILGIKLYKKVN